MAEKQYENRPKIEPLQPDIEKAPLQPNLENEEEEVEIGPEIGSKVA